jgi:hypothetical protein
MDTVTIVIRHDPTADGPFIVKVFKHYGDAELFVSRQTDPTQYELSQKQVELNG